MAGPNGFSRPLVVSHLPYNVPVKVLSLPLPLSSALTHTHSRARTHTASLLAWFLPFLLVALCTYPRTCPPCCIFQLPPTQTAVIPTYLLLAYTLEMVCGCALLVPV